MRFKAIAAAAVLTLLGGSPSSAAVLYTLTGTTNGPGLNNDPNPTAFSFTYTAPTFVSSNQTVTLDSCSAGPTATCANATFNPGGLLTNQFGGTDAFIGFNYNDFPVDGGGGTGYLFFQAGALGAPGTYSDSGFPVATPGAGNFGDAQLTVAVTGVPEPTTWALLILGFVGIGVLSRRRKNGAFRLV